MLGATTWQETGRRLTSFSKAMGVPFEFAAVTERLENLSIDQFDLRPGETLAVNCVLRLHQLPGDSLELHMASPRNATLEVLHSMNPRLVVLVEQHTEHNLPSFQSRFREALHYFSALFESLDAALPWHSTERVLIEERVLGRKIVNIVACEGGDRVERHESLARWRYRMMRVGFEGQPFSAEVIGSLMTLLKRYQEGYALAEYESAILLLWRGQPLLAASSWRVQGP
eukprot:jgi/Mesen1/3559/ME000199S02707